MKFKTKVPIEELESYETIPMSEAEKGMKDISKVYLKVGAIDDNTETSENIKNSKNVDYNVYHITMSELNEILRERTGLAETIFTAELIREE